MKRINPAYTINARKLRKNQSDVEKILWYHIRNKQIEELKFRRQYTVGSYIVDFINLENKLIIELDGGQHNSEELKEKDKDRTTYLKKQGYRIIRFWNNEVLENLEEVLESIKKAAFYPHPDPLP